MDLSSSDDELAVEAVERLKQRMGEIGTETTNFEVLIPDSTSQHFILGPALKSAETLPAIYICEFPKRKTEDFLINNQNAKFYEWFHESKRFWPSDDPNWVSWFQRVEDQKRYIWHQAGIYDVLQFSKFTIPFNRSLVLAALCFWSTSTNSFHLGQGPLTITLLDLSTLVGLRPDGPHLDVVLADSLSSSIPDDNFGIEFTKRSNFSSFIKRHNKVGVVTDEEHVAFLLYWLCRYLLCSRSFKIVKHYLPLAVALSRGESYALGPFVLAYLYRGINDMLHSQLGATGGPIWILQLWLHTYFPNVRPDCSVVPNLSCHGLKYVIFKNPEFSFHDCLMYMCHFDREENFNFIPYSNSDALPPWLIFPRSEMTKTELGTLKGMWTSFLVSRDLPVVTLKSSRYKTCGVEAYCPNLCARQFGLIQDIPAPPFFSFNTHFPERTTSNSPEQLQVLSFTTPHLLSKLKFAPFSVIPSATSSFSCWWTKYYKETFPEDLNYLLKLDDLARNRPHCPPKPSGSTESNFNLLPPKKARKDALKKRKGAIPIPELEPPRQRSKYKAQQEKSSNVTDGKGTSPYLVLVHAEEIPIPELDPPRNRMKHAAQQEKISNVTQGKEATFEKNTGPQSKQQQSDALDEGYIVELTENTINSKMNDPPLTQTLDTSSENLPSQILSPPTQEVAEPQPPQEPIARFPLQEQSSHPNPSSKDSGLKCDLKAKHSIRALDFLESYILLHPDVCILANTEEAPIPNSDEISKAKAMIQSISTLALDEVMEIENLQNLTSSMEILLKADVQTGVQFASIENVQERLGFVESKYHTASGITGEINKAFTQKIELEHDVQVCTHRLSEAQKEEQKFLTCITVQNSVIEELEKKLAEEKAFLKELEKHHASQKTKTNEANFKREHAQQMLCDHCIHEKTLAKKALEAKKDFKSVEVAWVQIQQLLSFISG